jgi:hypothetical protein
MVGAKPAALRTVSERKSDEMVIKRQIAVRGEKLSDWLRALDLAMMFER